MEWNSVPLFDVIAKKIDNRGKTPPTVPSGYPLLEVKHIKDESIYPEINDTKFVAQDTWDNWFRAHLEEDDIIFSTVGSIARISLVPKNPNFCIAQNLMGFRFDTSRVVPRFAFYFMKSSLFLNQVRARVIETVQQSIKETDLRQCHFLLPRLEEQRSIANILGTLDDKIELNRKMNHTLEAMARALFKSWFVDFDPVRTKMEGRQPAGMDAETAALFPDGFEMSELGEIPKGWRVFTFEQYCEARQGKYLPATEMEGKPVGTYTIPVWGGNGIRGYTHSAMYTKPVVLMTCRGSNCGLIDMTNSESWVSNISFACLPKIGSTSFMHVLFMAMDFSDCISGSAQPQITYISLKNKFIPAPLSNEAVEEASKLIDAFYALRSCNISQQNELSLLRDTLLPKLMSGQLRIKDAEKIVQEVA